MARKKQQRSRVELCQRVKRIKPYFTESIVAEGVDELSDKKLIAIVDAQ